MVVIYLRDSREVMLDCIMELMVNKRKMIKQKAFKVQNAMIKSIVVEDNHFVEEVPNLI